MRRLILLFSTALLAAWVFSQPASAVIGHSANGTGTSTQNGGSTFDFTATGGPGATGGGAVGSMTYTEPLFGVAVEAQVRCLFVSGNRATVVGLIVASTVPPPGSPSVGNYMIFYVEDNGTPGAGVDEWSAFFGGASETDCTQFVDLANPILTGEIFVQAVEQPPACPPNDEGEQGGGDDDQGQDEDDECPDDGDEGDDDQGEGD